MSALARISEMLSLANTSERNFLATIFYNEGWLLRLLLRRFSYGDMNCEGSNASENHRAPGAKLKPLATRPVRLS